MMSIDGFNHHRGVEAGQDGGFVFAHQSAMRRCMGGCAEDVGHDQHAAVVGKFLQCGDGVVDDVVLILVGLYAEDVEISGKPLGKKWSAKPR